MSTRQSITKSGPNSIRMGYEGNQGEVIEMPSCNLDDIDKALFYLFEKDIKFRYMRGGEMNKVPVIFATGERFALLARNKPLVDKTGVLILPLVSITRGNISQTGKNVAGQTLPIQIKRRIAEEDIYHQFYLNKQGLRNQDNLAHPSNLTEDGLQSSAPDVIAQRGSRLSSSDANLKPQLGNNIYEIFEIPPAKFITITYNITFWTQYTTQLNEMLQTLMSSYQNMHARSFRIESDKGWWFNAQVDEEISPENNFDDFTDQERLVRCSFSMTVDGYLLNNDAPGAISGVRRFVSAPYISFNTLDYDEANAHQESVGVASGRAGSYILDDMRNIDSYLPGGKVAENQLASSNAVGDYPLPGSAITTHDSRLEGSEQTVRGDTIKESAAIGGHLERPKDVFIKVGDRVARVTSRNNSTGETTLRYVDADVKIKDGI